MMSLIDNDDGDDDVDDVDRIGLSGDINGDDNFNVDEGYVEADAGSGKDFAAHDVDDVDDNYDDLYGDD